MWGGVGSQVMRCFIIIVMRYNLYDKIERKKKGEKEKLEGTLNMASDGVESPLGSPSPD